jgi:OmpA-OmpF porin, OOP family
MSKKMYLMSLLAVFACTAAFAQKTTMKKKATTAAATAQTVGYTTKPATPHQWEAGVGIGSALLYGDVQAIPGIGASAHVRRAIDHIFSVRGEGQMTRLTGLEPRATTVAVQPVAAAGILNKYYSATDKWFPNYQTTTYTGQLQLVISLNRFRFSRTDSKWNPYVYVGVGANLFDQKYNALNGSTKYAFNSINDNNTLGTTAARNAVKTAVKALLDGSYETSGSDGGTGRTKINPLASGGGGISYKLNNKVNVGLDLQAYLLLGNQNDGMDGHAGGTNRDFHFYPSLRANFNLGGPAGATEPLYWVNPLSETLAEIDEIAARPKLDLTDADGDGVVDMWDQDKTTPAGARVDTKGMALDSDGDGVPDYKDKEPYSPAGYLDRVDKTTGIADVPKEPVLTEADVNRIVDGKIAGLKTALDASIASSTGKNAAIVDWFLPIIHFDFDRYNVRTTEFDKLYQVANVMKQNPGINVLVSGHADKVSGNKYNSVLSFNRAQAAIDHLVGKYGIERSRLVLNYGGEETNLVKTAKESLMNRRVEFSVAKGESDMGRPAGPKAGKGNKSAGY